MIGKAFFVISFFELNKVITHYGVAESNSRKRDGAYMHTGPLVSIYW